MKLRYYRGSRDSYEAVEFDVEKRGHYETTCVVNVDLLRCGIKAAPCGNGDDYKLNPEERLEILKFVQEERRKLTEGIDVKSMEGWLQSGLPTFEDYAQPGDTVTEDIVEHFVNSVPPILMRQSCTQAGEAFSIAHDDNDIYRNTYTTFHKAGEGLWIFDGYCFKGENENREHGPSRLEQAIEEAKQEVERWRM